MDNKEAQLHEAVETVSTLISSPEARSKFLVSPAEYLADTGVQLSDTVIAEVRTTLEDMEEKLREVGLNNPYNNVGDSEEENEATSMNLVVAGVAAAVAVAATAAVTAVTAVTSMTDKDV